MYTMILGLGAAGHWWTLDRCCSLLTPNLLGQFVSELLLAAVEEAVGCTQWLELDCTHFSLPQFDSNSQWLSFVLKRYLSGSTVYFHRWSQQQDGHSCKCPCQKIPGTSAEWWWPVEEQADLAAYR